MALFSIVVPIYKVEDYLEECIKSILDQTFVDFELILVDDGSPDSCPQICDKYVEIDKRVSVIHQQNAGLVVARKTGLSKCSGDYVINIDSDDYIDSELLEKVKGIIDEFGSPDVIAFDYQNVDEQGIKRDIVVNLPEEKLYIGDCKNDIEKELLYSYNMKSFSNTGNIVFSIWSKVIKRELIERYQYQVPNEIRNGEDVAVAIPCIMSAKSVYILHYVGYYYRCRSVSMVHTFNINEMKNYRVLLRYLQELHLSQFNKNITGYGFRQIVIQLIKACRALNKYTEFKEYANCSITSDLSLIICNYDSSGLAIKGRIVSWLIKNRRWWAFYEFFKHRF